VSWKKEINSMGRRGSNYTDMGRKLSCLAGNQAELAEVLELTQQSVSGKLTGKIAVTLKDLEILSAHYDVPQFYFFAPPEVTREMAKSWDEAMRGSEAMQTLVRVAMALPEPFKLQLARTAQAVRATSGYYTDSWQTPVGAGVTQL
jgi:transcriptional regulator with XRE-family HTH domain